VGVESLPLEVTTQLSAPAFGAAPAAAHPAFHPSYTTVPSAAEAPDHDAPVRLRLGLQQRAASNLRNHVLRAVRRFTVLVVADMTSFAVMRELVRTVRDRAWLGHAIADPLQSTLPPGILNGWQFAAALFVALFVTRTYGRGDQRRDPQRLFTACALATALPLWMTLWTRGLEPVIVQYAITTLLVWVCLLAERRTIDRVVARFFPMYRYAAPTLFVGPAEACREAIESAGFVRGGEYRPVGFVDVHVPAARDALGHVAEFRAWLHRTGAEAVVVAGYLPDGRFREVVDASLEAESQLLSVPRSIAIAGVQPNLLWRQGQPLIALTTPGLKGWQLLLKRVVDVTGSALGLVVAAPLIVLIAAAIKLDSAGPVFFRQERIGTGGRRFRVWKFRTMRHGAPDEAHRELIRKMFNGQEAEAGHGNGNGKPVYKLVNDDRVTRVGRWLRRTSLDEVPQLINVLHGEMSLVGPRPPLPYETDAYDHWQFERLKVSPGITGLWQVSGRNLLTYRQMCELDLEYVRRWSLWLDFKILVKTIPAVVFNSGRAA
jgi:exopolysaccharide biosynthesis polyprenyl glycosylphosphotransferase